MAVATSKNITEPVAKTIWVDEVIGREVTLILNEDESNFLYAILGLISGNPKTSRRGLADSIRVALGDNGCKKSHDDLEGNIDCRDSDI